MGSKEPAPACTAIPTHRDSTQHSLTFAHRAAQPWEQARQALLLRACPGLNRPVLQLRQQLWREAERQGEVERLRQHDVGVPLPKGVAAAGQAIQRGQRLQQVPGQVSLLLQALAQARPGAGGQAQAAARGGVVDGEAGVEGHAQQHVALACCCYSEQAVALGVGARPQLAGARVQALCRKFRECSCGLAAGGSGGGWRRGASGGIAAAGAAAKCCIASRESAGGRAGWGAVQVGRRAAGLGAWGRCRGRHGLRLSWQTAGRD